MILDWVRIRRDRRGVWWLECEFPRGSYRTVWGCEITVGSRCRLQEPIAPEDAWKGAE